MASKFISYNEYPPPVNGLGQAYIELYNQLPYEVFATFSFKSQVGSIEAFRKVNNFLKRCKKAGVFKRVKFCGLHLYVVSILKQCHVHTLLISDPKSPRRFNRIDNSSIRSRLQTEICWQHIQNFWEGTYKYGSCRCKDIYDLNELGEYLTLKKNMNFFDIESFDIGFYRHKMLCHLTEGNLRFGDYMLIKGDDVNKK
jgi:hypothetical protein